MTLFVNSVKVAENTKCYFKVYRENLKSQTLSERSWNRSMRKLYYLGKEKKLNMVKSGTIRNMRNFILETHLLINMSHTKRSLKIFKILTKTYDQNTITCTKVIRIWRQTTPPLKFGMKICFMSRTRWLWNVMDWNNKLKQPSTSMTKLLRIVKLLWRLHIRFNKGENANASRSWQFKWKLPKILQS